MMIADKIPWIKSATFIATATFIGTLTLTVPAHAQVQAPGLSALIPTGPFLLRFDEAGNATITVGPNGTPTTLAGTLAIDPAAPQGVGGAPQSVLTFMLPEPVFAGDVSFTEVVGVPASDWLRFTDSAGNIRGVTGPGARMIFYSDLEPNEVNASPADKIFPTNLGTGNFLAQLEVGPEGNN